MGDSVTVKIGDRVSVFVVTRADEHGKDGEWVAGVVKSFAHGGHEGTIIGLDATGDGEEA